MFLLLCIALVRGSSTCKPKSQKCSDGFNIYTTSGSTAISSCEIVMIDYDFQFTSSCLSFFDITPLLEINANSTLKLEQGVFTAAGGVHVKGGIELRLSGVTNPDQLKTLELDQNSKISFLDKLIFNNNYELQEGRTYNFSNQTTFTENATLVVNSKSTLFTDKILFQESSCFKNIGNCSVTFSGDIIFNDQSTLSTNLVLCLHQSGKGKLIFRDYSKASISGFQFDSLMDVIISDNASFNVLSMGMLITMNNIVLSDYSTMNFIGKMSSLSFMAVGNAVVNLYSPFLFSTNSLSLDGSADVSTQSSTISQAYITTETASTTKNSRLMLLNCQFVTKKFTTRNTSVVKMSSTHFIADEINQYDSSETNFTNDNIVESTYWYARDSSFVTIDSSKNINFYRFPELRGNSTFIATNSCIEDNLDNSMGSLTITENSRFILKNSNITTNHLIRSYNTPTLHLINSTIYAHDLVGLYLSSTLISESSQIVIDPFDTTSYGDSILFIASEVVINLGDQTICKAPPFDVKNGSVNIEKGAVVAQSVSTCVNVIFFEFENPTVKYDKNTFISLYDNLILRRCPSVIDTNIYCELKYQPTGAELSDSIWSFQFCPCQNSESSVYVYADPSQVDIGKENIDIVFYDKEIDAILQSVESDTITQTISGTIRYLYLPNGIVVQGITTDMIIINDKYTLKVQRDVPTLIQHFQIGETSFEIDNSFNLVFYLNSGFDVFNLTMAEFLSTTMFISVNGIFVNEELDLCETVMIQPGSVSCLRKKVRACPNGYYLSGTLCKECIQNCKICTENICSLCQDNYQLVNDSCLPVTDELCLYYTNEHCTTCSEGGVINGTCEKSYSDPNCVSFYEDTCLLCDYVNNYYINRNGLCIKTLHSSIVSFDSVISCEDGYHLVGNECRKCVTGCAKCDSYRCFQCADTYTMMNTNNCLLSHCLKQEGDMCTECESEYAITVQGRCVFQIEHCVVMGMLNCLQCEPGWYLIGQNCYNTTTSCIEPTTFGCISCEDGYYATEKYVCQPCNRICSTCALGPSLCLTCGNSNYKDDATGSCISDVEIQEKCSSHLPNGKCTSCNDGYYLNNLACLSCDVSCSTCVIEKKCITCNSTNYMKDGTCVPQTSIIGCNSTITPESGCTSCQDGYYLATSDCGVCPINCTICDNAVCCLACKERYILMSNNVCILQEDVLHCVTSKNSKCTKCEFGYAPSKDGSYCNNQYPNWLIAVISICVILFCVFIGVIIMLIIFQVIMHRYKKNREEKYKIFSFDKEKFNFFTLNKHISSNKKLITFAHELEEFDKDSSNETQPLLRTKTVYVSTIPVMKQSIETLCIGNETSHSLKMQLIPKSDSDKLKISIEPNVITLYKNQACSISIKLTPLCTHHIIEDISIITKSIKSGEELQYFMHIDVETEISTRLDYDDLIQDKKLGEGSFGIVYLGNYKGNQVAIKKLRFVEGEAMIDFGKEVDMLSKLKSDYTVYFYGACFIEKHVCMVTEFAQFGSLRDYMKVNLHNPILMKLRIKFMSDSAKGIEYLHNNGILHRDIKPDNILVVSIEENVSVNAKLTDFGASRSINLLMTDMTFTKGVGTPVYMAPEILERQHYKMPADIYSMGIAIYEIITWKFPYQNMRSWDVADFVASGKRMDLLEIPQKYREVIEQCWRQDPTERYTSTQLKKQLNYIYETE
ncbi:protein serine/threonine kinase, putative [Entamoeba invadens IP1]|uniref:Protein serine/threonine kinase, putative n=1 Tax=Entamoeba invadens IP1 TaxID=370355 RepID=A0A0A1U6N2_ENTIV|nr:protein serine/threonine kinase, putative [Entamoeba invadens IP1]ELP87476.1 protein serine/threonine kinase, putative [Entamoeba invadens IP1]|eukprot:XP_004254247.1 protein serine/threonine kinase, putative [Entamoeba invadens IP1]